MNILYLLPFWPHLYTPFLFREMAWMRSRGHNVAVASLRQWPDGHINVVNYKLTDVPVLQMRRQYATDRSLLADALRACAAPAASRLSLRASLRREGLRHGLHQWAWMRQLVAFARQHRIDVIDAHWATEASQTARQIHLATGLPYTVTMHGGDIHTQPSPDLPQIVADAAAVLPISPFLAHRLQQLAPVPAERLRLRPHGLPAEALAAQPVPRTPGSLLVGTTGRLDPEKRQADLLDAAAVVAPECPDLHLLFIGGGQLQPALERQAQEHGLADRVRITGPLPWPQVIERLRTLYLYVQCSAVEGYGMTALEAAGQGLPVIATRTGAHELIVEEGVNGFLYEPGDIPAVAGHLRTILSDPSLRDRMAQASLDRVRKRFVFETLMPRVEAIFDAVRLGRPLPE